MAIVLSSREVADPGQKPLGERIADAAMRALQLWRIYPDFGQTDCFSGTLFWIWFEPLASLQTATAQPQSGSFQCEVLNKSFVSQL